MDDELEILRELVAQPEILVQAASTTGTELQRQAALRNHFTPAQVRTALLLNDLRTRAAAKFSRANEMWFDRTGLEQSTAELVAVHKAQRFASATEPVFDLCCGIGSDSIAIALAGPNVVGVDQSELACARTELNAGVYGMAEKVTTKKSAVEMVALPESCLVHIDPDRRAGRQRAIRLEDYAPPLDFLETLITRTQGGALKLSPASNFGGKFKGCEIELISLNGECKEATVWYGSLAGDFAMRATVLPAGYTIGGNPWEMRPHVGPRGQFVYDPDPAVVRAGLLDGLVEELNMRRLDDSEEYLTSDELILHPAVTAFEVIEELPNNERAYRNAIRDREFGEVEIKSRHVPTNADAMRKKMSLSGHGKVTLIIARLAGKTRALICKRVTSPDPA